MHDEASVLRNARREWIEEVMAKGRAKERAKIAESLRTSGITEDQIKQILGS